MTLKAYLIWMALGTAVAWGAFFVVVNYLNPATAGTTGFLFFYLSLFLGITGVLTAFAAERGASRPASTS